MRTEDLIATLAASAPPAAGPTLERRAARGVAAGGAVTLALFALLWGLRPALGTALSEPVVLAKTLLPLVLGGLASILVLRAARPGAKAGPAGWLVWAVPAAVAGLVFWAWGTTVPGQRLQLFMGHSIHVCLPSIAALSLPMLAGLLRALRCGAPVHPALCGALAGLAAGGLATTLYSLFCTEDSPLFYGVWYSLGILLVAGMGALAGRRMLRW